MSGIFSATMLQTSTKLVGLLLWPYTGIEMMFVIHHFRNQNDVYEIYDQL